MPRLRSFGRMMYQAGGIVMLVLWPFILSNGVLTSQGKRLALGLFIGALLAVSFGLGFASARAPKTDEHLLMSGAWYDTVCQAPVPSKVNTFNLIAVVRPRGMPDPPFLTVRLSLPEGQRLPSCFRFRRTIVPERTEYEFQA